MIGNKSEPNKLKAADLLKIIDTLDSDTLREITKGLINNPNIAMCGGYIFCSTKIHGVTNC